MKDGETGRNWKRDKSKLRIQICIKMIREIFIFQKHVKKKTLKFNIQFNATFLFFNEFMQRIMMMSLHRKDESMLKGTTI